MLLDEVLQVLPTPTELAGIVVASAISVHFTSPTTTPPKTMTLPRWALELANNPLVKRVIAVLDKNKDGSISFLEFVQGLNSLSAGSTQEEKLRFAF